MFVEGAIKPNEWTHLVQTYDSETTALEIYVNGVLMVGQNAQKPGLPGPGVLLLGHRSGANNEQHFAGMLDDVQIYDEVLDAEQISSLCKKRPIARDPSPTNGSTDVPRDVDISWSPGEFANTHDVYFGTVFDDVNDASKTNPLNVLLSQGQSATIYDPESLLEFGQTYYWRIDEVNAPPDNTIFKGNLWSFTVEPIAYPIAGENITATASSSNAANEGPENTINSSGLDADDLHSAVNTDMWLSSTTGPQPT